MHPDVSLHAAMQRRQKLVVIGNGMAGARTVEEILLRGGGEQFDITVFGEEPYGNYNRILLSNVLNGSQDVRDIFLHPVTWYEENGITLHTGDRVASIDLAERAVRSESGRTAAYDRLIIATGSRPLVPPIDGLRLHDGSTKPGVFVFRTLDDCRRIAGYAKGCRTAAVIGGGLLGLEAANGLRDHGVEVHVVHQAGHLMERQLDPQAGAILRATIEGLGVTVHLEKTTSAALGDEQITGLSFTDGTVLDCDMVVVACGVRPNVELAAEAGLLVERAIVVDDQLRSVGDPRVYAVGECVQHRGTLYGLVAPLWEQAQVLAGHITGRAPDAAYLGSGLATRLKVMGVELAVMGAVEPEDAADEVVQFIEPRRGIYKKLIIRDERLIGAILLGDGGKVPYLMQVFDRGTPLPEERAALLFELGTRPSVSIDEMTDEATVCHCNGVSKLDIRDCVAGGACTLQAAMRATRAGTGCGTCKPLVREMVERFRAGLPGGAIPVEGLVTAP